VHYRASGTTGPVVVLFHESPSSSVVYEPVLQRLGHHVQAFAFDTPGYGASDPPPDAREIPEYAAALLEAMDGLGLQQFTVVGSHTGAGLGLQVALQAGGDRNIAAVLSGVPFYTQAQREAFLATWAPERSIDADGSHLTWAWERYQRVWGPETDPQVLHLGVSLLLPVLPRYTWAYNASFRHDCGPDLIAMTAPTLLLTAEDDMLVDMDLAALALLRNGRMRTVPGLSGQLSLSAPDVLAGAVLDLTTG
jgi:pimeloyl-ACP methyl ester carboxylesterase